jgi:hypothetical protein
MSGSFRRERIVMYRSLEWSLGDQHLAREGDMSDIAVSFLAPYALWLSIALAVALIVYYIRHRRLQARHRRVQRMADTLMQNVQGLILSVHANISELRADHPVRQQIETVLDRADALLSELRQRMEKICQLN